MLSFRLVMFVLPGVVAIVGTILAAKYAPQGSQVVGRISSIFQWFLASIAVIYLPATMYWHLTKDTFILQLTLSLIGLGLLAIPTLMRARPWLYSVWSSLNPPLSSFGYTALILTFTSSNVPSWSSPSIIVSGLVASLIALRTIRDFRAFLFFGANILAGVLVGLFALQAGVAYQAIQAEQVYEAMILGGTINLLQIKWYMGEFGI